MKKVLTIVFDGFGIKENEYGNAIKEANMHYFNKFMNENPHTLLYASEEQIGLLPGQMGTSEVGHMTIGAGRIIKSSVDSINDFFDSEKKENEAFVKLLEDKDKKAHIMGLCSDGNVHSNFESFIKMYHLLIENGFKKIYFHLITDGRDTKINVSYNFIRQIQSEIQNKNIGHIATISGRYYAMDRDQNFERTKLYYDLITSGYGNKAKDVKSAIDFSYMNNITDEFIKPVLLDENGLIADGDILIWLNYRKDRAIQILGAFADPKFNSFNRNKYNNLTIYSFFEIDKNIKTEVFIPNKPLDKSLGIYFSELGIKQARIAESEKYPHVTYFFDGGYDGKIDNCDKFHIPSPSVPTYDLKPEMSALEVTKKIIDCMEEGYDFIFANYANPDMVGHTGSFDATVKACMTLDVCLGELIEAAEKNFYRIALISDHGNADTMLNEDGSICTTHSLERVPFIINDQNIKLKEGGNLSNVAPTLLDYMDISIPIQMESESLLIKKE